MRVLDGGLTNNLPCFHDNVRRQLVFDLSRVAYPVSLTLSPSDPCIESLVLRGALEFRQFAFQVGAGGMSLARNSRAPIFWYDPKGLGSPCSVVRMLPTVRDITRRGLWVLFFMWSL